MLLKGAEEWKSVRLWSFFVLLLQGTVEIANT